MTATLVAFTDKGKRRQINLNEGITLVGRRPECDIRVPVMQVSRKHCNIVNRDGKVIIQDLGSSNGTYLNQKRIEQQAEIAPGDIVAIGPIQFVLQLNGHPAKIETPSFQKVSPSHPESSAGGSQTFSAEVPAGAVAADKPFDPLTALADPDDSRFSGDN